MLFKLKKQLTPKGFNLANCSCTLLTKDPSCEIHAGQKSIAKIFHSSKANRKPY